MATTYLTNSAHKVQSGYVADITLIPAVPGAFVLNRADGLMYFGDIDGWKKVGLVPPNISDALFWLDGEISGSEFVDKTGNGRNFTINDKDFTAEYLPYKSIATISAPAADAILIAADINNFLYDSGGTPNQIPVVAFFQNVDYEDKLFVRHISQVLNGNNVETAEPYVKDVVLYDTALTGQDLIDANIYFSVPIRTTPAVWVDPDGLDTNPGTEASPFLTIVKGYTSAGSGNPALIKSKEYTESIYNLNGSNMVGIGFVDFVSSSGAYGARIRYGTPNYLFKRFVMRAALIATNAIYGQNSEQLEIEDCYIESNANNVVSGDFKTIKNTVIKGANGSHTINNATGTQERTIDTVFFKNTSGGGTIYNPNGMGKLNVLNCKVDVQNTRFLWNLNASAGVDLIGNEITQVGGAYYIFSTGNLGLLQLLYNTFNVNKTTSNVINIVDHETNAPVIRGNSILCAIDVDQYVVLLTDSQLECHDNIFRHEGEIPANGEILCQITKAGSYAAVKATGNRIESKRTGGYHIGIGSEGTTLGDNDIGEIEISMNYIMGRHAYPSPTTNTVHASFVGFQVNADVKYNFTMGVGYASIYKGSTGIAYTAKGEHHNVHKEFVRGVFSKGVNGVNILNNTFFSENINPEYAIKLDNNTGGDAASDCIIKNNIFIYLGTGVFNPIEILNGGTGNLADYNLYYCPNGTLTFINANGNRTFAQWQTDGFDANGKILSDVEFAGLFTDYANDDFSLKGGSAAIGAGETLAAEYDDGLDSSTDWGNSTTVPAVVTKQQSVPWDCGAYVS